MKTKALLQSLLILACLAGASLKLQAQGTAFIYQAQLSVGGVPANGSYDLAFTLYATNVTGSAVAGPVTNTAVNLSNGLFMTSVDFGNVYTGVSNWLEIAISTNGANAFSTLAPRQPLTPVPYAVTAANLSGTLANANLPSNAVFQGTVTAAGLAGSGAGLTNLAAGQLTGTLPAAVLPAGLVSTNPYYLAVLTNSLVAAGYQYGTPDYSQWPDGWNSWFYCGNGLSETLISNVLMTLKTNGYAACGLTTLSFDASLFTNRDANGIPMMNGTAFPHGFPWLCQFILDNGFKVGIYAVVTNNVGLAGDNLNDYIFGAEDAQANYFLTNGVTYYKVDAPLNGGSPYWGNAYPNERDYFGNIVTPMANPWDSSYLRFVTDLRSADHPVFVNASFFINTNGQFSPNVKLLLNSYRLTQTSTANSIGMMIGGDNLGAHSPLIDWSWLNQSVVFMAPYLGGYFFPDLDPLSNHLWPDAQRKFYSAAFLGSIFQIGSSIYPQFGSPFMSWYHNATNELAGSLLHQIRARQTTPKFLYATNGCLIYGKNNFSGGLDLLVLNENYAIVPGGDGSTIEIPQDYTPYGDGVMQYTNDFSDNGTNYQYVFTATNAAINFAQLKLWSSNCIVTTVDNGGASAEVVGGFSPLVFAAGARLYTLTPVASFPASTAAYRDLTAEKYFLFWATNQWDYEPVFNAFNAQPPLFGGQSVTGLQLGDSTSSYVTWGINGASSFTALTGVDGYGHNYGGHLTFYVDGLPVYTNWPLASGYTNVTINFSATNQFFTICASNRNYLGNPRMNYANSLMTANGDAAGLTNLQASQLVGTIAMANMPTNSGILSGTTNTPLQDFAATNIPGGTVIGFLGTNSSGALVVTTNVATSQLTGSLALAQLPAAVVTNNASGYFTNYMSVGTGVAPTFAILSTNITGVAIIGHDARFQLSFNVLSPLGLGGANLIQINYSQTNSVSAPTPVFSAASTNAAYMGMHYGGWYTTAESTNGFILGVFTVESPATLSNCVLNFTVGQ